MTLNWPKIKKIFSQYSLQKDQQGIYRRYLSENKAWESHLSKCHQVICNKCGSAHKIAILGSGWLLDVPVDYLLDNFQELHCYDIVHPKSIIHRFRNNPKIKFIQIDITNGLYDFLSKNRINNDSIKQMLNYNWTHNWDEYDFVVSLNLLNQLDILFIDYLKKKVNIKEDVEIALRKKIQKDHLLGLPKSKTLLISDITQYNQHLKTSEKTSTNLIHTALPNSNLIAEWQWLFDSKGTYLKNHCTWFKVKAYQL